MGSAKINREELAWAAGLLDGEGYVNSYWDNKSKRHIRIACYQANKPMLERFQRAVLGMGTVMGPRTDKSYLQRKPMYEWRTQKFEEVQAVVALLWNWMSEPKKSQAKQALFGFRKV